MHIYIYIVHSICHFHNSILTSPSFQHCTTSHESLFFLIYKIAVGVVTTVAAVAVAVVAETAVDHIGVPVYNQ